MNEKLLPAVYENQRDNVFDGGVTCAVTAFSMLIQSKDMADGETREHKQLEDTILQDLKSKYADHKSRREDFNFLVKYAKDVYGIALRYAGYNKNDWLALMVNSKTPFITSTSNALTSFGHIVLWRGYRVNEQGYLTLCFNDPYGHYPYKNAAESGEKVYYPVSLFPFDDGKGTQKKYHTLTFAN